MDKKIKLAFVVDVENWAFANIARNFKKYLDTDFDIRILPMSKIDGNSVVMWLMLQDFDVIHFFCRGLSISYLEEYFKSQLNEFGGNYDDFIKEYVKGKIITTCVYDHLFLDNEYAFTQRLFSIVDNYYVSSNILKDKYDSLDIQYKPKMVVTDGINLNQFYPINMERFDDLSNRKIKVGWVGNSKWENNGVDYKGVYTVIKPAIEKLQKEGYNIELYTSDKLDKHIPIDQMVNYYAKIDLYVCASIAEGTPNPVLESMACGVPIISTDVGIVRDALGEKQSDMILENRDVDSLVNKIKYLIDNPGKFREFSNENIERIKSWSWDKKASDFKKFILDIYKK